MKSHVCDGGHQPDLAFVIGATNHYMSNPGKKHWKAMKHILHYLKITKNMQLTFGLNHPTEVEGFTNPNYANNPDNQKSI